MTDERTDEPRDTQNTHKARREQTGEPSSRSAHLHLLFAPLIRSQILRIDDGRAKQSIHLSTTLPTNLRTYPTQPTTIRYGRRRRR